MRRTIILVCFANLVSLFQLHPPACFPLKPYTTPVQHAAQCSVVPFAWPEAGLWIASSLTHNRQFCCLLVRLVLLWSKEKAGNERLCKTFIGWPKTQLQAPTSRYHYPMLALLPFAATGSGGPSPRLPPPKRQNTKGVMPSSLDKYRRGGWSKLAAQIAVKVLRRSTRTEKVELYHPNGYRCVNPNLPVGGDSRSSSLLDALVSWFIIG